MPAVIMTLQTIAGNCCDIVTIKKAPDMRKQQAERMISKTSVFKWMPVSPVVVRFCVFSVVQSCASELCELG